MNTTTNPYHAHIAEIEKQAKLEALRTVDAIRASREHLQSCADALLRIEIQNAETERLLEQLKAELGLQHILHAAHSTLNQH